MTDVPKQRIPTICILGGGFSGICAGIRLKTELHFENFTIFEENEEFGGTWLCHTYPKCASDIATHLYSFSFEQNPNWSQTFCGHSEILAYLTSIAAKHSLYDNVKFYHQVQKLTWVAPKNKWFVVTYHTKTQQISEWIFDIVIAGPGQLRVPNIVEIFKNFKGPLIHTADWDHSIELKDKVVAVIGSGASAVQVIPGIVNDVKKMYSFQRSPTYVFFKPQIRIPLWIRKLFATFPWLMQALRTLIFFLHEFIFPAWKNNSLMQYIAQFLCLLNLLLGIPKNPELRHKLTPDYRFGCQHPCFSNSYYPALAQAHVEVIRESVTSVEDTTITTDDGVKREIDVIITATGYKQMGETFFHPCEIYIQSETGDVRNISNFGRKDAQFYLGTLTSIFPNMFVSLGPNSTVQHNSAVFSIECQMNWMVQVIRKMIRNGDQVVRVKQAVQVEYNKKLQQDMKGLVFGGDAKCNSWFVDKDTRINNISLASSSLGFWNKTRKVRWQDLEFS